MYTAYFGFHQNPFHVTPNPHCFYSTPLYQAAYTRLLAGIHERKGLLMLTGEVGSGKTTLLRKLMTECKAAASCVLLYNPAFAFDDLLSMIYEGFSLPEKGGKRQQRIQDLHKFLLAQWQTGRLVALFIDEAQKLEDEAVDSLQLLLDFRITDTPLLQLVLVGPPELEEKLAQSRFRRLASRIAVHCQLSYLRGKEVGSFIHHQLQLAGCGRQDLFPPETIHRVARYSQGVPRLINVICDNALRIAYRTRRDTVSPDVIEEVADKLRLKKGFSFVEAKVERRATPPSPVSELLWQEAEQPPLAETALGFHQARLFSGFLLFLVAVAGLLVYMTSGPASVSSILQSPSLTPSASLVALPQREGVAAVVAETQLASERQIDSLDRGSLPPSQTAERGEMIFKSIVQHYPQVRPLVWGLATKNPKVAIFLPETVWTRLTKEDQVSLTLFAAGLVPLIRTKPDAYVEVARTDPRYRAFRARIARLCADCWAIGVGRPTFDEKGILFEQILVQGDSAWKKSAPGSKGVKASEFLQRGRFVSPEKQKSRFG